MPELDDAALPVHASDDLWTTEAQRIETATDAAETAAATAAEAPDATEAETPVTAEVSESDALAADATRDADGKFAKRAGKPRHDPQARVQQATAKEAAAKEDARLAREEAATLKARLDALEASTKPSAQPAKPTASGPKFPDFTAWSSDHPDGDYDDYRDDRDDWRRAQGQQATAEQRAEAEHFARLPQAVQKYPDFQEVISRANLPLSDVMARAIVHSPLGPDMLYYLGTHPEDCLQLARESQETARDAVPLMRRYLESLVAAGAVARSDSASAVRPSSAKPPINRVGGTASATPVAPDDLEFGPDYIRLENQREKKRQEAQRW